VDDALGLMLDVQETEAEIRAESAVKPANSWYVRRNWPELEAIGRWPALGKVKPSDVLPLYRVFRTRANEMDRVDPRLEEPMRELRAYLEARVAQLEDYSAM
jgi:hypothetical protein